MGTTADHAGVVDVQIAPEWQRDPKLARGHVLPVSELPPWHPLFAMPCAETVRRRAVTNARSGDGSRLASLMCHAMGVLRIWLASTKVVEVR